MEYNPADMAKRKAKKSARPRATAEAQRREGRQTSKHAVTLAAIVRAKEARNCSWKRSCARLWRRRAGRRLPAIRFAPLDGSDGQFFLHEVWETREHHNGIRDAAFSPLERRKDALLAAREATFWQQIA